MISNYFQGSKFKIYELRQLSEIINKINTLFKSILSIFTVILIY